MLCDLLIPHVLDGRYEQGGVDESAGGAAHPNIYEGRGVPYPAAGDGASNIICIYLAVLNFAHGEIVDGENGGFVHRLGAEDGGDAGVQCPYASIAKGVRQDR